MKKLIYVFALIVSISLISCSGSKDKEPNDGVDRGVGPVKHVDVGATVDQSMAAEGEKIFVVKCSACHKLDTKYVGPALRQVTKRRSPEWIMNMILNPDRMTKENATAKELLGIHMTQMTNQNLQQADARKLLEYLRSVAN